MESIEIICERLRRVLDELKNVEKLSKDSQFYGIERSAAHIKSHVEVLLESLMKAPLSEAES